MPTPRTQIRIDPKGNVPYLPVAGFPELCLTKYRPEDVDSLVHVANHPSVGQWSFRRAYPANDPRYNESDAKAFLDLVLGEHATTCDAVVASLGSDAPPPMAAYPLGALRYVPVTTGAPSGRLADLCLVPEQFLGNMFIWPSSEKCTAGEMLQRDPADQVWEIAYDLAPEVQGRGIGQAVICAALESWIGWLGIGTVVANIQTINRPSRRVAAYCGFIEVGQWMSPWPEDKGGGERENVRCVWTSMGRDRVAY